MATAAAPAASAVDLDRAELLFVLHASLMASAMLGNDYGQFRKLMRELVIANLDFTPTQRADLIQKFMEALRS